MPTINYYQTECYPESVIREYAQAIKDIQPAPALSSREVAQDHYLRDGGKALGFFGPIRIDRLWRFTDEAAAPALAFHKTFPSDPSDEQVFHLYYIDPSLTDSWRKEMDRDREIEQEVVTYRILVSNIGNIDPTDPTDYDEAAHLFAFYKDAGYGQVTLWSSIGHDPIKEHENPNAVDGKR